MMQRFTFLGIVLTENNGMLEIEFMLRSGDYFYWPVVVDKQILPATEVLCKLKQAPVPYSSRYFQIYEVKMIDILKNQLFQNI